MKNLILLLTFICSSLLAYGQSSLELSSYVFGFNRPVDIAHAGDARLFVVEQAGRIIVIDENGVKRNTPFLDIRSSVNLSQNEQGMLGLAFHPDYATNGFFYVNYITGNGDGRTRVSRFTVSANDPNIADPASEEIIFDFTQPDWNHNGGDLNFGPDGYLYLGFGDGGSGGDPWGNGQNPQTFLGKLLRIDVDNGLPYTIPPDNPYVDDSDVLDEIWAIGLRNPWRFSFDALTGDLWIGDVGQNAREEIDFQPAASTGGENYGWDCREGDLDFSQSSNLCVPNLVLTEPVVSYKVSNFCNSVTGGYVYRGCKYPDLYGRYLYADYCNGLIWSILPGPQGTWTNEEVFSNGAYDISSFGVDAEGELYAARLQSGILYRVRMGEELSSPDIEVNGNQLSVPTGLGTYQWYLNGNPLAGADAPSLEVTEDGDYSIEIVYDNGCLTFSDPVSIVLVGTEELLTLRRFNIHPNPFSATVQVDIELEEAGPMDFAIFDLKGQKVASFDAGMDGRFLERLELGHLPKGVYFLKLSTEKGEIVRRLVRQ